MELANIISESLDALFAFNLRASAATAQRLTDGIDAVIRQCALDMPDVVRSTLS